VNHGACCFIGPECFSLQKEPRIRLVTLEITIELFKTLIDQTQQLAISKLVLIEQAERNSIHMLQKTFKVCILPCLVGRLFKS
jgi:hypothetical protein